MKKIIIFTTGMGHLSIATKVAEILNNNYQVDLIRENESTLQFYLPIYRYKPSFFKYLFNLAKKNIFYYPFRFYYKQKHYKKILEKIKKEDYSLVISCYFILNPALENACKKQKIKLINITTDPRTLHKAQISGFSKNTVFDQKQKEIAKVINNNTNYFITGWFVQSQFERKYNKKSIRKNLKLENKLTLLFTTGSNGTENILKILKNLKPYKNKVQMIVACGNNRRLKEKIKKMDSFITLGFVTNMHEYMQAADLVIGKAGPNTLFESVATLTPFHATTHIHGQEDGNLDLIREYKLGFVEENPQKAVGLLQKIINNPKILEKFKPHLKKMSEYNKESSQRLRNYVTQTLKNT